MRSVDEFIEKYIEQIDKNDWANIYNKAIDELDIYTSELTLTLLEAGINPLDHLDYIPSRYLHSSDIKYFDIPNHIKTIDSAAFAQSNLEGKFIIPNSVENINYRAFRSCINLEEVHFLDTVLQIESEAFLDCKNLKRIYLPHALEEISSRCFFNCNQLKDIYYDGTWEDWENLWIGQAAFGTDQTINHSLKARITLHLADGSTKYLGEY